MSRGQDLVTENKILVLFLVGLFALHAGFSYSLLQAVHGVEEQVGDEGELVEPPLPDSMWDAMDVSMIKEVAYRHYPELDFSEVEFVWRVADLGGTWRAYWIIRPIVE
jgi:hypothetical protein